MPKVTNEHLATLIGGLDDKMIALASVVAVVVAKVDALQKSEAEANGRQRTDHDMLLSIAKTQETCPARKAHSEGDTDPATAWGLARWGIKQYGVFGVLAVIIGVMGVLLLKANGVI